MAVDLESRLKALLDMPPISDGQLPSDMPNRGVYLFTEFGNHLYVGRSKNLQSCYKSNSSPGAWHRSASFAIRLACDWLGVNELTYQAGGPSQKNPVLDSNSGKAFTAAKARIRAMDYRFIEETDARRALLLEVYCSVVLAVPYTYFETATCSP
jgi:hypothetical protein